MRCGQWPMIPRRHRRALLHEGGRPFQVLPRCRPPGRAAGAGLGCLSSPSLPQSSPGRVARPGRRGAFSLACCSCLRWCCSWRHCSSAAALAHPRKGGKRAPVFIRRGDVMGSFSRSERRGAGGRPAGPVRQALRDVIGAGLSGPADALAVLTGWPPESVCLALREMRRAGELDAVDLGPVRSSASRSRGRPPKVYAAARADVSGAAQALAFVQTVWR